MNNPPVALTIAGSDCSAGAGIQADLKTFQHFAVHGLTAVTCVVSETANVVRAVHAVPVGLVSDQISLMMESFPVAAVKTGMLFSSDIIQCVAEILKAHPSVPLVVDPVMVASTGNPLLERDAVAAYRAMLLPLATLVTPNLPEAEILLGRAIPGAGDLEQAALDLSAKLGTAVLLKGGHLPGEECIDLLAANGRTLHFPAARIPVSASHGTGCTLSAAITALLAHGESLERAVSLAKSYLGETLLHSYALRAASGEIVHALNQGIMLPKNEA